MGTGRLHYETSCLLQLVAFYAMPPNGLLSRKKQRVPAVSSDGGPQSRNDLRGEDNNMQQNWLSDATGCIVNQGNNAKPE
jgi:hypothetical protein